METFYSTVEVESLEFHGKASKSKKEAEQDAAKIAYIALQECKLIVLAQCYVSHLLSCIRKHIEGIFIISP